MNITADQYERPGAFYLGRGYSLQKRELTDELVLYDSRDLVTHGVVLGMTGSGKTGLCLALLEEAAMDGIPVIAIDPKGDIGNLLLTFPGLTAEEFRPWINEDDARRRNADPDEYARAQAELWRKGLSDWGQDGERIRRLRDQVDLAIYTPGSSAGLPVSILSSLQVPPRSILDDAELLAEMVEGTASSLLGLAGVEADPVQSVEHVLLSNVLGHCWRAGESLTLENLVRFVQQPPFQRVGVVDLDTFCPEAKRTALALKLNNIIASPGFATWVAGEPLDIQRMLFTREGKPRVSIFNLAHLSDSERMFFVSLLLNEMVGWMRGQQGTTSLRAILYMDEIFGFLPPTAMPPSKKPMLLLLKQARAFGLGVLLATQNPVDLDYKALSNIGTWWLGRLQTERDKARVLDGLEGAPGEGPLDRAALDATLSALGNRVFLMKNVHEDAPVVMHARWAMSYLNGPLGREQVKRLMGPARAASESSRGTPAGPDSGFAPPARSAAAQSGAKRSSVRPSLPANVAELFLPHESEEPTYVPAMLRSAEVMMDDAKRGITGTTTVTIVNPIDLEGGRVLWDQQVDVGGASPGDLASAPPVGATFAELPPAALKSSTYTSIKKDFADWVYANHKVELYNAPVLQAWSKPGERIDEFRSRIAQLARERRDQAVDELREKTAGKVRVLEDRIARSSLKVETQRSQATSAKMTSALTIGGSLLGVMMGRKRGFGSLLRTTNINSAGRVQRESREAAAAEAELERIQSDLADLEASLAAESEQLREQFDPTHLEVETARVSPLKKNVRVTAVGILWIPEERL